jgi:hypothetical protein
LIDYDFVHFQKALYAVFKQYDRKE